MRLQIIKYAMGKTTGVYILINKWKKLKKQYKNPEVLEYEEPTKQQLIEELKEASIQLTQIEKGKLKSRSAKFLLDEL